MVADNLKNPSSDNPDQVLFDKVVPGARIVPSSIPLDRLNAAALASLSGGAQVASGTYTGNGADNRVISTGLTSPVKSIQFSILPQATFDANRSYLAHWNPTMGTSIAWSASDTGHLFTPAQGTVRPNANDFEVDDSFVNQLDAVYHWTAWA